MFDFSRERRRKIFAADQAEESLLKADGARDQVPRTHLAAIFEADPDCFAVFDQDLLDPMIQENAPTGLRERLPQRMGERVGTANADMPVVDLAQQQRERNGQPSAISRVTSSAA